MSKSKIYSQTKNLIFAKAFLTYNMNKQLLKGEVMFVSSYNTYINTNSSQKSNKSELDNKQESGKLFSTKLTQNIESKSLIYSNKPVNYIKDSNAQYNKELIRSAQEQMKNNLESDFKKATSSIEKYSATQTVANAKAAYVQNSSLFAFLRKPQATLDQTPKVDTTATQNLQDMSEKNIRYTMINTYIENDKYYQITA